MTMDPDHPQPDSQAQSSEADPKTQTQGHGSPEDAEELVDGLGREVSIDETTVLQEEIASLRDQLLRSQADAQNMQRRARHQVEEQARYAAGPLAKSLIEVIDNFERALEHSQSTDEGKTSLFQGVEMVHRQLLDALAKQGITPMTTVGQPFDPTLHEAIMQQPTSECPEGTVCLEMSRGYMHHEMVLRPAKVGVAIAPAE